MRDNEFIKSLFGDITEESNSTKGNDDIIEKQYQTDIFTVLEEMQQQNYNFYDDLLELNAANNHGGNNTQPPINFYVLMKWMSHPFLKPKEDALYRENLTLINTIMNDNFWLLQKEPKLLWLLCCVVGKIYQYRARPDEPLPKTRFGWIGYSKNKKVLDKHDTNNEDDDNITIS